MINVLVIDDCAHGYGDYSSVRLAIPGGGDDVRYGESFFVHCQIVVRQHCRTVHQTVVIQSHSSRNALPGEWERQYADDRRHWWSLSKALAAYVSLAMMTALNIGGGTTTVGGGTAISGGGTPDTGGGTPFRLNLTTAVLCTEQSLWKMTMTRNLFLLVSCSCSMLYKETPTDTAVGLRIK